MNSPYLKRHFRLTVLAAISFFLIACGDDENTQPDDPTVNTAPAPTAVVATGNAEEILLSALEAIQAKASTNEASSYIASVVGDMMQGNITNITPPPGFSLCDNSVMPTPAISSNVGSIDFVNLCILSPDGVKVTLNGAVTFSFDNAGNASINTTNLAITTSNNETYLLTLNIDVNQGNVTLDMTLMDPLGVEISTANLEVSGGMYSGITDVSGSIMVVNYGTVNVNMLDPLEFGCTGNNVPSSGTVEVVGVDDSSASITFNDDCNTYTVTVNGVAGDPIPWSGTATTPIQVPAPVM